MRWLWIAMGAGGALCLVALIYWQLIVAEGAYLGPHVVAWTYEKVARRYDAIKQFDVQEESWFVAAPLLQKLIGVQNPLLLDVATGTGRLPLALLRSHFSGRIVGLDLSLRMLYAARVKLLQFGDRVGLVWQDARRLPFEDGIFDAVTCLEALEFFPNPLESLAEMVRVLAPGGILFISNRVGRDALFLPGHTIRRSDIAQSLAALGLCEIDVRPWQVSYDLALARKEHRDGPCPSLSSGRESRLDWRTALRCPSCCQPLQGTPVRLSCSACGRVFPVRDGIVQMASCHRARPIPKPVGRDAHT